MRLFVRLFVFAAFLASAPALAQEATPTPAPVVSQDFTHDPAGPPYNLISGSITPLIVLNSVGLEYERMLHPMLGGIAVRGHAEYVFLGVFDVAGFGIGAHYVYYLPIDLIGGLDARLRTGAPAGPFVGLGADVTVWQGRYFGPGSFEARIRGTSFEPNFYVGYRAIVEKFFIAPRAGFGFAFGGGGYRDSAGNRHYYSRGRDAELHFELIVGLAF